MLYVNAMSNQKDFRRKATILTGSSGISGWCRIVASVAGTALMSAVATGQVATNQTIARDWDEQILSAIRIDKPHPPVHARNLFSLSVCMYDAWAAYTNGPVGYVFRQKATAADIASARREAISYAAYQILKERFALSVSAAVTLPALDAHLASLGYDPSNQTRDLTKPAGVGNSVYDAVSAWFINDGSYQTNGYKDLLPSKGGYSPINDYLNTGYSGTTVVDINHWQPLEIANAVDQNGLPSGPQQKFLGSQWLGVRPFALARTDSTRAWIDPGPPPMLGKASSDAFRSNVVEDILRSSQLTPDDGVIADYSPGTIGNNTVGTNDGKGYSINPVTGKPYAANPAKRGDFARVIAEFFADGPNSETPPGHWNVIANGVSDSTNFVKRLYGTGPVVDPLEWDVKVYFALNAAVHEAACAAWSLKRQYDGWRPISAIRYMGQAGQSSDRQQPSFSTNGLPLIPGLIELVTAATAAPGGRHAGLPVGKVVILAWSGPPSDPTQHSGVHWILPGDWFPYQKANFVTPAFPGYISGHSTFSRAAAEVLTAITGSPFLPGGMGSHTAPLGAGLSTEYGPSETIQLQWATYYDAADLAGVSRLWGGIHPPLDDFTGRVIGSQCGKGVLELAKRFFDGSVGSSDVALSIQKQSPTIQRLTYSTVRGLFYKQQSTPALSIPFTDDTSGFVTAYDASVVSTNSSSGAKRFYRVLTSLNP